MTNPLVDWAPFGAAVAMILPLAAGCSSSGPRPVAPYARPDGSMLERFGVAGFEPGTPAVALIADPKLVDPVLAAAGADSEAPDEIVVPIEFSDVLRSVETQFPLILAALEEIEIAAGSRLSAEGGFDTRVKADSFLGLDGFYENETAKILIEQPIEAGGATFFGGYKVGAGDFPIWEGGLKTNEGGEFSGGVRLPLLAGRAIDARRLALWQSRLAESQADPIILEKRLAATRKAALTYWKWVATTQKLRIAERLLLLAQDRQAGVEQRVAAGDLPDIAVDENRRLLVERESILIRSTRDVQQSAIELSLYLRGEGGQPRMPRLAEAPEALPKPFDPAVTIADGDIDRALELRPEVRSMQIERQKLELDLAKAENDLLPTLNFSVAGSRDIGDEVSNPDDKGPFELDAIIDFDLPIQRRSAKGKVQVVESKLRKIDRELQFVRDRVVADVRDAEVALRQTWLIIGLTQETVRLLGVLEEAERLQFREGESDLLRVNIRERETASAASRLVDVTAEFFRSFVDYRASVGVPYDEVK